MPEYIQKSSPIFLSADDENEFADRLRVLVPDVLFVDGQRWQSPEPPVQDMISDCSSSLVYIWSSTACAKLPYKQLANGSYQGPSSGVVVQLDRCRRAGDILFSGQIGIGYDKNDFRIVEFVDRVWNTLKALNACTLSSMNPDNHAVIKKSIKIYVVGSHAKKLSNQGIQLMPPDGNIYYSAEA